MTASGVEQFPNPTQRRCRVVTGGDPASANQCSNCVRRREFNSHHRADRRWPPLSADRSVASVRSYRRHVAVARHCRQLSRARGNTSTRARHSSRAPPPRRQANIRSRYSTSSEHLLNRERPHAASFETRVLNAHACASVPCLYHSRSAHAKLHRSPLTPGSTWPGPAIGTTLAYEFAGHSNTTTMAPSGRAAP